jgi:hypothetical protein
MGCFVIRTIAAKLSILRWIYLRNMAIRGTLNISDMLKPPIFPKCLYVEEEKQCTQELKSIKTALPERVSNSKESDVLQDTSSEPLTDLTMAKGRKCKTE